MLAAYLRDHALPIVLYLLTILMASSFELMLGFPLSFVLVIDVLYLAVGGFMLAHTYVRSMRYFAELHALLHITKDADESLAPTTADPTSTPAPSPALIADLLPEPTTLFAALSSEAIERACARALSQVEEAQRAHENYHEYIETWVHQIKTPLTTAQVALHNGGDGTAHELGVQLRRIEHDVDQVLFYARSTSLEKDFMVRRCTVHDVVTEALRTYADDLIAAGVVPQLEDLDVEVECDPKWLVFMLGQIFVNAAKYQVEDAAAQRRNNLCIRAVCHEHSEGSSSIDLFITDGGVGIPAADLPRIFERGFTGSNGRAGMAKSTGMGLYLCQQLAHKMNLHLSAASTDAGTTITISFPRSSYVASHLGR